MSWQIWVLIWLHNFKTHILYHCFYLSEGAGSLPDHPDNSKRDADHWRHGHEPADPVAPVGVSVHIVVLKRFVFNQEEEENTLKQMKNNIRAVGVRCVGAVGQVVAQL